MTNNNVKSLAVDVHGLAASNVNTEKGTMSNVQVENKAIAVNKRKGMAKSKIKLSTLKTILEGIAEAIENDPDRVAGASIDVTPKQYDEIMAHKNNIFKWLASSKLAEYTGLQVTLIDGMCKNMPLLGTKIMVYLKKVK